jgi:hypothetical protein
MMTTKTRKEESEEMKFIKVLLVIVAAAMITLTLSGNGLAFHEEGVAYCAGCHVMHNSQDGEAIVPGGAGGYLLRQTDGSSTCLRCHADYGQLTGVDADSPPGGSGYGGGGDFYWLKRDFIWSAHGRTQESLGDSHGHNIIAADFGLTKTDGKLGTQAPGGTFDNELSCASCHDPHGNENYLLLRGNEQHDGATFPAAPIAVSPGRRTASSNAVSDSNHPAYGSGMSAWCAGCHTSFDNGLIDRMHPADFQMSTEIRNIYNGYVSTADPTGGTQDTAYREFVAFQTGAMDTSTLDTKSTKGPDAGAEVACISCHRAHASAFPDMMRWYPNSELLNESHPDGATDGSTPEEKLHSYYGNDIDVLFGPDQRSLCNKCHNKDGPHG